MAYKNPIKPYRAIKRYDAGKRRLRPGALPKRAIQCGNGVANGDERYCPACGKSWPKNESHP